MLRKNGFILFSCFISSFLAGCNNSKADFKLAYDFAKVSRISIIDAHGELRNCDDLFVVEEKECFYNSLLKINFYNYLPIGDQPNIYSGYAVKILYDNYDEEYVGYSAQIRYIDNLRYTIRCWCEKQDLYSLIKEYYPADIWFFSKKYDKAKRVVVYFLKNIVKQYL